MSIKNIWEEIQFFFRQKLFMAATLLTLAGSYGFAVTHESIGPDDTMVKLYLGQGMEAYMGRWTLYLVNKLFRIDSFMPFVTELAGAVLLLAGVVLFCVLLRRIFGDKVGILGYTVFACVFISFPFISEVWIYYFHNGVDLGYILLALSLLLFMDGFENTGKGRLGYFLGSTLLLCAAVGCYESFLILYVTGVLVILFFRGMTGREQMSLRVVWKLFVCVCISIGCILLRTVIQRLVIMVFSLQALGEITAAREVANTLGMFGGQNWAYNLFMLVKRYWLVFFVNAAVYFPIAEYAASVIFFGIASIFLTVKKKNGWYLLLSAGMAAAPVTLSFVVEMAPSYHSCLFMPFFVAAAMLLPYLLLKKVWKKYGAAVFAFFMVCLVWNQMYETNSIFYTDYLKYHHDKETLTEIAREVIGEYGADAKVIFTGSYKTPYTLVRDYYIDYSSSELQTIAILTDWLDPHLKEKYYTPYGYSFVGDLKDSVIEWGLYAYGKPGLELQNFLEMHGYSLQVETDLELHAKAEAFAQGEGMPGWPEKGSIAVMDEYVIVHF